MIDAKYLKWFSCNRLLPVLLGTALGLLWFIPSLDALSANDPESFQRRGSLLVALAVLTFAIPRRSERFLRRFVEEDPLGLDAKARKIAAWENEHQELLQAVNARRETEESSDPAQEEELKRMGVKLQDIRQTFEEIRQEDERTRTRVRRGLLVHNSLELLLICVGTLQWGYGDKFACWWNAHGWKVCY